MKTRNAEVLADFVKYCQEHPDERFWQALRNWSGYQFITARSWGNDEYNTFYIEGKRHDEG